MKTVFALVFLLLVIWLPAQTLRLVVPVGHTDALSAVAFSPDGKNILTGSYDGMAKLWNLKGQEIQTYKGHSDAITSIAFSPDGKYILTGSMDETAKLWNFTGQVIHRFVGHNDIVNSVAISPDGKYILTGSDDATAKLWNLTGRKIRTFKGFNRRVNSVAFSPDGKQILISGGDGLVYLKNLKGQKIQTFRCNSSYIAFVAFSTDGKYILTGGETSAELWNLLGQEIQTFWPSNHFKISSMAFSPDGKQILTGGENGIACLWNLTGQEILSFKSANSDEITSVAFSPDGRKILIGGNNGTAELWDLAGQKIQTITGHASKISSVAFSPDGKQVLTANNSNAWLWNLQGRKVKSFDNNNISSVAFSPDGKQFLVGCYGNIAQLWSLEGQKIQTFEVYNSYQRKWIEPFSYSYVPVAFSPNKKHILIGDLNNGAQLYNLRSREIINFKGHTETVASVAFSLDGNQVLTGSLDETAKLWDLTGREIYTFKGHKSGVISVAFSPNSKYILTGSWDATAKLWTLSGHNIQTFKSYKSGILSVSFSPDSKYILTGGWKEAKLWDMSGHEIQSFKGHDSEIGSAIFSPDGKYILTGSDDNTTKLWSTTTGRELGTLISIDSTDWVVTTPTGLFDASPGAMKLMHYMIGLDVIELDQLKERYYEPGLLSKIMGFDKSELRNVAAFDQVALYPEIKAGIEKDQLAILLTERNGGMGKLSLFLNGKEVQEDINPKRLKDLNIDLNTFAKYYQTDTLNTIALRAYNAEGWLKSQAYELAYQPAAKQIGKAIPHLYALVVGTSNYAGEQLDLRFADQDAAAMSQALHDAGSALFGADRTQVRLLSTAGSSDASSKTNIRQAFTDLAAKATPADVLVVYFSGHGLAYGPAEKEQFYYLTKDISSEDLSDPVVRDNYTISSNEFTQWLTAIPAQKQVMILDACNAGKVVESLASIAQKALDPSQIRALDRMKDRTGMFILTGSAADQVSYEASQYGQGLLTYSLLQGMSGLALKENKYVDVNTLFQYACDQVPLLAQGIGGVQKPILASPGGASFDIGLVDAGVKIPVAQVKPVFIRNVFQDETSFDDVLGLTDALETYFRAITAKGAQAELIFVDVKEYDNAWSMKGLYKVRGDVVEVRGRLFKGKESKGEFQANGKKNDVAGLVAGILEQVRQIIK